MELPTTARLLAVVAPRAGWPRSTLIVAASLALFVACAWSGPRELPVRWAADGVVTVLFAVVGARLLDAGYTCGRWFVAAGALWAATTLHWAGPALGGLRWSAWALLWLTLGLGCLAYAGDRLRRPARRSSFVVSAAVGTVLLTVITVARVLAPRWPPGTLLADGFSTITMICWLTVLTRHARRLRRADAVLLLPVAATLAVTLAGVRLTLRGTDGVLLAPMDSPVALLVGLVPLSVLLAVVARRFAHASVAGLIGELPGPPTVEAVQAVLRRALQDDTATVLYRLPGEPGYVSADGLPAVVPSEQDGRLLVNAVDHGRVDLIATRHHHTGTVALVHVDAALRLHRDMVEAAVLACGPALAHARLQAVNRARLDELRASRAGAVAAAMGERQRLERDLHDGAQQGLLAVSARLGAARAVTHDLATLHAIDTAREHLRRALAELRRLTRGLYPAVLASEGLAAALESSADERTLDTDIDVPARRFDQAVEIAALVTIDELLTIAERHCGARRAVVRATADQRELRVRLWHDGRPAGGADSRVLIVTDRLRALNGDLTVRADPAGRPDRDGVLFEAAIPCE
jgi:signal transduction histidine kinase